ncbi:MAG TPA: LysR substrate-binding domain-containing protein [Steroidobacteraceae bacterium]|jgi:LysR family hydrogen peroxide-inducible transcriptional activator|nr:LysR substrate-binding domain-containing protein [Steroidobacteraceae bacterium]
MNLRDLRYLVALADTRHFGRAAQRCHVSQPTLSAQIKKLENYLGVQLIERHPRRVALTETGAKIVSLARRMIQESDEIISLARNEHDPLSGRLNVALIPTVGPYLLPLVTRRLRKQLPRLKLMLYEYQTERLLEKLRAGDIDLGVLALPVNLDGLDSRDLYVEPFTLAVPNTSPIAKKPHVKLEDIADETLLLLEDGHCLRDQALDVCSRIDVRESDDYRATSLETLRQMVAAGLGVTLLPELATRGPFGSGQGLAVKSFSKPVPSRTVGAVWRKSSTRGAALKAVCDVIHDTMAEQK